MTNFCQAISEAAHVRIRKTHLLLICWLIEAAITLFVSGRKKIGFVWNLFIYSETIRTNHIRDCQKKIGDDFFLDFLRIFWEIRIKSEVDDVMTFIFDLVFTLSLFD